MDTTFPEPTARSKRFFGRTGPRVRTHRRPPTCVWLRTTREARVSEDRRWQRQRLRWRMPPRSGLPVIVVHDVLTLLRLPSRLLAIVALAAVPGFLVALACSGSVLAAGWLCSGLLAIGQVTGNVRYDVDRPTLARLMGLTDRRLLAVRSVVPTVAAAVWGAGSVGFVVAQTGGGVAMACGLGALAGPGLAAGALRAARRSFVRHDYPLIVTPQGVVPSGPVLWVGQAVDVALFGTLPTLVALATGLFDVRTLVIQAALSGLTLAGYLTLGPGPRQSQRFGIRARALIARVTTTIWRL